MIARKLRIRSCKNRFFQFFNELAVSSEFQALIVFAIIANTIILCFDAYPKPYLDIKYSEILNVCFTSVFFLVMLVKLLAFGIKPYLSDSFNAFDCFVIVLSIVDIGSEFLGNLIE